MKYGSKNIQLVPFWNLLLPALEGDLPTRMASIVSVSTPSNCSSASTVPTWSSSSSSLMECFLLAAKAFVCRNWELGDCRCVEFSKEFSLECSAECSGIWHSGSPSSKGKLCDLRGRGEIRWGGEEEEEGGKLKLKLEEVDGRREVFGEEEDAESVATKWCEKLSSISLTLRSLTIICVLSCKQVESVLCAQ